MTIGALAITIKIIPSVSDDPVNKLADAELIFGPEAGLLAGWRLVGFTIWKHSRNERKLTLPARTYFVLGERRAYALLRPLVEGSEDRLRAAILEAYDEYEKTPTQSRTPAA